MAIDRQQIVKPGRPFSHLAIRPYPGEYERRVRLTDGTECRLRPIKPEDEPLWHELLASCSQESIWSRFRYLFKQTTHEMAARFCYLDYDRELAIVAEVDVEGGKKLAGVGRLVADADHRQAEYAVLVSDRWQSHGLGGLLTDYCLEIARDWQLRGVVAETSPANTRMLRIFRERGFELDSTLAPDVILARLAI